MGNGDFLTRKERAALAEQSRLRAEAELQAILAARARFATKIAMVVVDHINDRVIRPGPTAEERECYDMAQELHDLKPELVALIARIIEVQEREEKDRTP